MQGKIMILLSAQFLLLMILPSTFSVLPPNFWKNKLDKAAFLQITKNSPITLITHKLKKQVKYDSVFKRLQIQYARLQQTFYSEARSLSGGIQDGMDDVIKSCGSCATAFILGRERTRCYANCMAREMNTFDSYALQIGDAVHNFFCLPLGFGFETQFETGNFNNFPSWFWSFNDFVTKFNAYNETFTTSALIEAWMSNLFWLDKTPLFLHSYIRSQVALDISSRQNNRNMSQSINLDGSIMETPAKFAAKCGLEWDLSKPVYSLINAAKQKSHFIDIILRGLYTVKAAAFYTLGNYHNLAGGIIEALNAMVGTKCDIISYSDGADVSETTCDSIGKYPIPQFPIPLIFSKFVLPCEDNLMSLHYSK